MLLESLIIILRSDRRKKEIFLKLHPFTYAQRCICDSSRFCIGLLPLINPIGKTQLEEIEE